MRRIVRNALSNYGLRFALGLSALIITPYLYRQLGADGFGTWSVIFALASVASLLEMGLSAGVAKFVAEHRGTESRAELETTVGTAVTIFAGFAVITAAAIAGIGVLASGLAPDSHRDAFSAGMLVLAAAVGIRLPLIAYAATLEGYQRWDLLSLALGVTPLAFTVGAFVAVELGGEVLALSLVYGAALVASGVVAALLLHAVDPELRLRPRLGSGAPRRRLAAFSTLTLLAESMNFMAQRMDVVVIAAVRNAAAAAPFAAAVKLQTAVQSLILPFVVLLMPMSSEAWARGERGRVADSLVLGTRVALQIVLPVAIGLAVFADDIVDLWLGSVAPPVTADIIVVLLAVQVVVLTVAPAEKVLIGVGSVRLVGALATVEGIANLGLSLILVSSYGAIGAALGTLLTSALLQPVKLPLACRLAGVTAGRILRRGVGPALAASVPALAVMLAVRFALPSGTVRPLVGLAAGGALGLAVPIVQVGPRRLIGALRRPAAPGRPIELIS